MKPTKAQLFKRQITLQEIGKAGQEKLQSASVLVVGCGGLGSAIAVYLASSGIGNIHLVDFDSVDVSNLHRQVFYSLEDVGQPKAAVLAAFIQKRAPYTEVRFTNQRITKENVFKLMENGAIVVDATDALPTKYLLNDACVIKNKPLVYGSLYKFDGYVATFNVLEKDGSYSSNLRDAFPKMATDIPNCEEVGTLNAIVGIIAMLQVNEVLKWITCTGKPLSNKVLIYNSLENTQLKMKLKSVISKQEIEQIFKNETYVDTSCGLRNQEWLITAEQLKNKKEEFKIISVIENLAMEYPFKVHQKTTISKIESKEFQPEENLKYVFVCLQGNTSYNATKLMRDKNPDLEIFSLIGGIINY